MKYIRFTALLCSALLTLSACGPAADSGTTPPADADSSVQTAQPVPTPSALAIYPDYSLHPVLAGNRANLTLAPLLYEPLFQVDESFQAVPVLCRDYTVSEDKLVWTLTIHSDITFSDGTPLTAETVAAALKLACSGDSRYQQRLAHIRSVTGKDQSVTITLDYPNGSLPALLDIPIALGEDARPLGTGPYVLSGEENNLSLSARQDWWQDKSLPAESLPLQTIFKTDELIFSFGSGDVALVDVDLMGTNALGYSGNYEIWDYSTSDLIYLGFNTLSGPCRSPELRQTIAQAIDRSSVAKTIYASHAVPTALPIHPDSPLYSASIARKLEYDPDPLVELVSSLRASNRSVELIVNNENASKVSTARLIAYQLEAAGMEVTLNAMSFEDYSAALASGAFDLYVGEVVLTADFDLAPLLTSRLNYGGWYHEEAASLLYAMAGADSDARAHTSDAVMAMLSDQVPIAPICFKNGCVLTQWGRLSGLSPIRGNVFYQLENWIIA